MPWMHLKTMCVHCVGEQFDGIGVTVISQNISGRRLWQRVSVYFIDGSVNAQFDRDSILTSFVMSSPPHVARPCFAKICTVPGSCERAIPVLAGPVCSRGIQYVPRWAAVRMLWMDMYDSVPVPASFQKCPKEVRESVFCLQLPHAVPPSCNNLTQFFFLSV